MEETKVTQKAKAAISHLTGLLSVTERAELKIMQAKMGLAKNDTVSRDAVTNAQNAFNAFRSRVNEAIAIIAEANPSKAEEE